MAERKRQQSLGRRIFNRILFCFVLLFFIAAMIGGLWFYNRYGRDILELRAEARIIAAGSSREDFRSAQTSICYYSDGSIMQVLSGVKNVYYLPYESIPKIAVNAFLAVEDRKFWSHKGYDVYAIARAAKAYIEHEGEVKQGGSTITQQLARGTYLTNEKTVNRKVKEIFLAAALEQKYSKYDILEFYINNAYFANGYYGLQAAAMGYFGCPAGELSLSALAFLCGIPNSPSAHDPRAHFDKAMERRDSVLKQMKDTNYITKEEYDAALKEVPVIISSVQERNNYEETYAYRCAVQALMEADGFVTRYSFDGAEDESLYKELYDAEYSRVWRNLYTKGYRIYTSINPAKQAQLQAAIDDELADNTETNDSGIYKLQASGVCIDNETGLVVAIIGGRYQEYNGYTLNRAFQSPRQPGSSIKPLIVYTPALEMGYYPETIVVDEKFEGGPRNSGGVYSGAIELRQAVAVSKNTIAWRIFNDEVGIEKGLDYLLRMNFSHIVSTDYYPAASLGGLTYGATAVEMAAAYAALANDGVFRKPTCIKLITNASGDAVVNNTTTVTLAVNTLAPRRIYDKNASRMMTDILTSVMTVGTGRRLALEGQTSAGKTGTTNDQKDGWFLGYTRYYTTGIWVGCDLPKAIEDLMGNTYPGRIWHNYMEQIHKGLPDKGFEPYIDNRPIEDRYPYGWVDTDGDGIPDGYPNGWVDTDGDGIPDDYADDWTDFDGDGIPDGPAVWLAPEKWVDTDGDGDPDTYIGSADILPGRWVDTDGDGLADTFVNLSPGTVLSDKSDEQDEREGQEEQNGSEEIDGSDAADEEADKSANDLDREMSADRDGSNTDSGWDGSSEGIWDGSNETTWDGSNEATWDGSSEATWDGSSEATWDGSSEATWDGSSEATWGGSSTDSGWDGGRQGDWDGTNEGTWDGL